jgi:tetratricopeptide (TPR) repeat protein
VTVVQAMAAAVKELDNGSLADQPLVEAGVRETIGTTLQGLARYDDAEPNLRKSLAIRRAALPAGHPDIVSGLNILGSLLLDQNKLDEAEPLLREALTINRAARPGDDPQTAICLDGLSRLLRDPRRPGGCGAADARVRRDVETTPQGCSP